MNPASGVVSVEMVGLDTVVIALDKLKTQIPKTGVRTVSNVAADARNIAYVSFFTKKPSQGGLRYNSPDRPFYQDRPYGGGRSGIRRRHREPLASNASGYYDIRGTKHRLVHFGLTSRNMLESTAHVSSYPMNLWERPSKDGRSGLWVMTVKLPSAVNARMNKYISQAEGELEKQANMFMEAEA